MATPPNKPPRRRSDITAPAISRREILAFVDQVVSKFRPSKVILFGSYAYGEPNADSDVDLLVVMRHRETESKTATRIRLACPRSFPIDLIVQSPAEVRRRIKMGDCFMEEIILKGAVLHEANYARMG